MRPKGLLIAVVLLAVLGGFTWWSAKHPPDATKAPADSNTTKLLTVPDDQFQGVKITKVTGETIELKKEGGKWRMTSPKPMAADQDAAGAIQSTLASLSSDKLIDEKPANLKEFGLDTPTLDVQVMRKDGKTEHLLIGDDTLTGSGAYAKLANDP